MVLVAVAQPLLILEAIIPNAFLRHVQTCRSFWTLGDAKIVRVTLIPILSLGIVLQTFALPIKY